MTLQDKFERVQSILHEHNNAILNGKTLKNPPPIGYIDPDKFTSNLKIMGGTNEERLRKFSYEDILGCLDIFGTDIKPTPIAKEIAGVFRGKEEPQEDKRPVSSRKAERMTARELVESFDPEESDNPVGKRLKEISKGEAFIVYESGRIVNAEATLNLLNEIKQGFPGRDSYELDGTIRKVYRVGEAPENYADENPLWHNRPLRPDGTCDQTGRSWAGVPAKAKQLIYLAVKCGEIKVSIDKAHDVLDIALSENTLEKLKRYKEANIKFIELEGLGELPTLKVPVGNTSKKMFDNGKRVEWVRDGNCYRNSRD